MNEPAFLPLAFEAISDLETLERAKAFEAAMKRRRTVRDFSPEPVSRAVIESAIRTAAGASSGANQQPWTFVAISDPAVKARIRAAAEGEEKAFYDGRAGDEWLKALKALGTDWRKPFLETAPWLIVIFQQRWGVSPEGRKVKHYYARNRSGSRPAFSLRRCTRPGLRRSPIRRRRWAS
ncbi:MAG TPA: nitroreductase family protein [Beijerinckiaceae bacterium]|nr:nitroreductase family protein [Beijerinckiaceae bacterium]